MVTIIDVAKKANVSKSTVSQYLNKRYKYMSLETKARINEAIEELNYIPNHVGRSLRQKKTAMIGVIVANILHNFSTQFTRGIEDICNEHGIQVILCNADDNPIKERHYIEMLKARQVDGLFVFPTGDNHDLYEEMLKANFPLVFIDRFVDELDIDAVLIDNFKATSLAVEHFKSNVFKNMGILTTTLVNQVTTRIERIEGFKKALSHHNLPFHQEWINGVEILSMQRLLECMFSKQKKPEAILAGNDLTLTEILKFAKNKGYKIPQDFALIAIDHITYASHYDPTITTIVQPVDYLTQEAFKLMNRKMKCKSNENLKPKEIIRVPPELLVRQSSLNTKQSKESGEDGI